MIGGQFHTYDGQAASLVELNTDGSLSKIVAVVMTNSIESIMMTADSKILIYGRFTFVNGKNKISFARFNTDGTLDETLKPISTIREQP